MLFFTMIIICLYITIFYYISEADRVPNQIPMDNLGRMGNHYRQKNRPRNPSDLDFDLQLQHVPDGMEVVDVPVEGKRHLVLYTHNQMKLLGRAKRWFVDGTFKASIIMDIYNIDL